MKFLKMFIPQTLRGWICLALLAAGVFMLMHGHPEGVLPAMAIMDAENMFSGTSVAGVLTGQALVVAAATPSTNVVDQLGARVLGAGKVPDFLVQYTITAGAATTLRAVLYGADDAAMATNKVLLSDTTISGVLPNGSSGFLRAAIKVTKAKRFLRVEYDLAGAAGTANVISGFIDQEQTTPETIS